MTAEFVLESGAKFSHEEPQRYSIYAETKKSTQGPSPATTNDSDPTSAYSTLLNDDNMAELLSKMISQQGKVGMDMWTTLAARASALASINWLASHVPSCVLDHVSEETRLWDERQRNLLVSSHQCNKPELFDNIIDSLDDLSLSDLSSSDRSDSTSSDDNSTSSSESSSLELLKQVGLDIGLDLDSLDSLGDMDGLPLSTQTNSLSNRRTFTSIGKQSMRRVSISSESQKRLPAAMISRIPSTTLSKKWKSLSDFSLVAPVHQRSTKQVSGPSSSSCRSTSSGFSPMKESHESIFGLNGFHNIAMYEGKSSAHINKSVGSVKNEFSSIHQESQRMLRRESYSSQRDTVTVVQTEAIRSTTPKRKEYDEGHLKRCYASVGNLSSLARSQRSKCRGSRSSKQSLNFFPGQLELPYASRHVSALLFIDISGFTRLSTLLDPESLSNAINAYFHQIVDLVTLHGGDILKFAGDAVFAEWKTTSRSPETLEERKHKTTNSCICAAAICAAAVVAQYSDFPVLSDGNGTGEQVATLNVHCGLGVGDLVGLHLGDHETRREYVVLGDPIDQVALAEGAADLGEVAASPKFLTAMAKTCRLEGSLAAIVHFDKPMVIAQRGIAYFTVDSSHRLIVEGKSLSRGVAQHTESWEGLVLAQYRKLLSLYAHPVVVANDSATLQNPQVKSTIEERQREEAELRNVYVMFITPLISVKLTGNNEFDCSTFRMLNNILNVTTRELNRFSGHLRQFIVDDKGVVLIATFGLRGSTFPNMVAERALPATIMIHRILCSELGVQSRIGATVGKTYCGVVGGVKRHEYAVLGPSVNLAARLMANAKNPGILVDENVRMLANHTFSFAALAPVVAKGYIDPVPIFEPLNTLERGWGKAKTNFVGRRVEVLKLVKVALAMANASLPARMMLFNGESGMGKTATVVHGIEQILKVMQSSRRRIIVTKHVSNECDQLVPFSAFASIFLDVLNYSQGWFEAETHSSQGGCSNLSNKSSTHVSDCHMNESMDSFTEAYSLSDSNLAPILRLRALCEHMDAPPEFLEIVGRHLHKTGLTFPIQEFVSPKNKKATATSSLISFMAKSIRRCTENAHLILIAIDNVHQTDEMSWRVIQELFETAKNVFLVCTSRPLSTYKLAMDETFWRHLHEKYEKNGRFVSFQLGPLSREEVLCMIAKTVNVHQGEVAAELVHDIHTQSGGMPQFVNELIEMAKWRGSIKIVDREGIDRQGRRSSMDYNGKITKYTSLGQLILHRIDSLDANVRNILNLGAILGDSFELIEVVEVLCQLHVEPNKALRGDQVQQTVAMLHVAEKEGILRVVYGGGDNQSCMSRSPSHSAFDSGLVKSISDTGVFDTLVYSFCHDIWRSTILKLMLSSRRRDVHRIIAHTLESHQTDDTKDYISRMKLFSHWLGSGTFTKVAELALSIGQRFEQLGLNHHRIRLAQQALDIFAVSDSNESSGVLSRQVLESATASEVEYMIKLEITMGQAHANIHNAAESVSAFRAALKILQEAKSTTDLRDRSILFPIFSGLFVALKLGSMKQDEAFEKKLAARFVKEAKAHGDPVHYSRALAIEAELYGRLGEFNRALLTVAEIEGVYDLQKHTAAISQIYGSDRPAQAIGLRSLWYYQMADEDKALCNCDLVINGLLPRMDIRNVHNAFVLLIPSLWVMKENNLAQAARINFEKYVTEPFHVYYPEGSFTPLLPLFKPITMLFDLAYYSSSADERSPYFEEYLQWALDAVHLRPPLIMNSVGGYGRLPGTVTSEICLFLAMKLENGPDREKLVKNGLEVASEALTYAIENMLTAAEMFTRPIYEKLKLLSDGSNHRMCNLSISDSANDDISKVGP